MSSGFDPDEWLGGKFSDGEMLVILPEKLVKAALQGYKDDLWTAMDVPSSWGGSSQCGIR